FVKVAGRLRVQVAAEDQRAAARLTDVCDQVGPVLAGPDRLDAVDAERGELLRDQRRHRALVPRRVRARRRDQLTRELDELVAPAPQELDEQAVGRRRRAHRRTLTVSRSRIPRHGAQYSVTASAPSGASASPVASRRPASASPTNGYASTEIIP